MRYQEYLRLSQIAESYRCGFDKSNPFRCRDPFHYLDLKGGPQIVAALLSFMTAALSLGVAIVFTGAISLAAAVHLAYSIPRAGTRRTERLTR